MHTLQVQQQPSETTTKFNRWLLRKVTQRYRSRQTGSLHPNTFRRQWRRELTARSLNQDDSVHNSGFISPTETVEVGVKDGSGGQQLGSDTCAFRDFFPQGEDLWQIFPRSAH